MVQQTRKTIVVTGETFETLRSLGTVTESFNDVILRLIEKSKANESKQQKGKGSPAIQQ
jgi:predicted CopG family antitoxin